MRTPPLSVNQRRAILERDNYTCQECGHVGELGVQRGCVQVHHIQARYNGGTNDSKNLVTLCYDCHKKADVQLGRPTTYGQTMLRRTVLMPPAMWGWVEATGAGNVSVGIRQAVDAVSLLSREQWAWLTRRDDAPAALEDAVRQAMDMQRAEAEADALAPTYNGGRW